MRSTLLVVFASLVALVSSCAMNEPPADRARVGHVAQALDPVPAATWTKVPSAVWPILGSVHGAFDPKTNHYVLNGYAFDGANSSHQTWEWDSAAQAWSERVHDTSHASPQDDIAKMIGTSAATGLTLWVSECSYIDRVAYTDMCIYSGETWKYNGTSWTKIAALPSPRKGFSLAWDEGRERAVLFGGSSCTYTKNSFDNTYSESCKALADTWEWSTASGWEKKSDSSAVPARRSAAMAWDRVRGHVVLYGGNGDPGSYGGYAIGGMYEWNGSSWSEINLGAVTPGEQAGHPMVSDPAGGRIILAADEDWIWNGSAWSKGPTSKLRPAVYNDTYGTPNGATTFAFDRAAGLAIEYLSTEFWYGDHYLWQWSAATGWSTYAPPQPWFKGAFATDYSRKGLLYYIHDAGSVSGLDAIDETWEFDGAWHRRNVGAFLGYSPLLAPDPNGNGAIGVDTQSGDTYRWNGTTWSKIGSGGPSDYSAIAMATDLQRKRVVANSSNGTLEWDGAAWSNPSTTSQRRFYWDAGRKAVATTEVSAPSTHLATWSGTAWVDAPVIATPSSVSPTGTASTFVYNEARNDLVDVFGSSTWELAGTTWANAAATNVPASVFGGAYEPSERVVVVGSDVGSASSEISFWTYVRVGGTCATSADCPAGACVDGVCCTTTSCPTCQACNIPGYLGVCAAVVGRSDGLDCTGVCSASGACLQGPGQSCNGKPQVCSTSSCTDGVCCDSASCGTCQTCAGAIGGTCTAVTNAEDDSCKGEHTCDDQGECKLKDKSACTDGAACASHQCYQGKCCSGDACRKGLGETCATASDCASNHCADGVCCDRACTGACEACGASGMCAFLAKGTKSHAGHPGCNAPGGACDGQCNGVSPDCAYPGADAACEGSQCIGSSILPHQCNGAGSCIAAPPRACAGNFACEDSSNACRTTCLSNTDCASGSVCDPVARTCGNAASRCTDASNLLTADGKTVSCHPGRCNAGNCVIDCDKDADCAQGSLCQHGICVDPNQQGAGPESVTTDSGCSAAPGAPETGGGVVTVLGLIGLLALRRRRTASGAALLLVGCNKQDVVNNEGANAHKDAVTCGTAPATPGADGRAMVYTPFGTGSCFFIDEDEVTVEAYGHFVAANAHPATLDASCAAETTYAPAACGGSTDANAPVTCVTWCGAEAYCAWAGKRLCKGTTAGAGDGNTSEWYAACADPVSERPYPYAGDYAPATCNGSDNGKMAVVPVRSSAACVTPEGAFDLSGNAAEWTAECTGADCLARGGSYISDGSDLSCKTSRAVARTSPQPWLGFRCCAGQ